MKLDHIVSVAPDLGAAAGTWRQAGFEVRTGGRHGGQPTRNELVPLADGVYVELLGPTGRWVVPALRLVERTRWADGYRRRKGPVPRRFLRLLSRFPGMADLCFHTDDLEEVVARGRSAGLSIPDPEAMSRVRPDGARISWRLAVPDDPELPFFIQDETERALRVPAPDPSAGPAATVRRVRVGVSDVEKAGRGFAALLGLAAKDGGFRVDRVMVGLVPAGPGPRIRLEMDVGGRSVGVLPPGVAAVDRGAGRDDS